jgi:signal transduction histidine kinase
VTRPTEWLSKWIPILAAGLYFVAVTLRTWLFFRDGPQLGRALILLLLWLLLILSEPAFSRRWTSYFPVYLIVQTGLVFALITLPGTPDFLGALLGVLSMQAMLRLPTRVVAGWIGLCALIMGLLFARSYQYEAIALSLIYTAGNVFLGSYTRTIRMAQAARRQNQALAGKLEAANQQLQEYSGRLEQLAATRERNRLARELHDSVTQTVFSMNLTSQSAALLFERDQRQAGVQLERLYELSRSALTEMQILTEELRPCPSDGESLPDSLRLLFADSRFSNSLVTSLEIQGSQILSPFEEQGLFRIAQEALNNIRKHAQTSQAQVRLHLEPPFWIEIEDLGRGFDLHQAQCSGHIGIASMRERAEEIGWKLQIETSVGVGTRVRVEKPGLEVGHGGIQ